MENSQSEWESSDQTRSVFIYLFKRKKGERNGEKGKQR